jgi:hypothetical protein
VHAVEMPLAPTQDRPDSDSDVIFLDGVGQTTESVLERRAPVRPMVLVWVVAGVVACIVAAAALLGGEPAADAEAEAAQTTAAPQPTTVRTTLPAVDPALSAGVVEGSLPQARPAAVVVGLTEASVFSLDLVSGESTAEELVGQTVAPVLLDVAGETLIFDRDRVVRLGQDGAELELATGVDSLERSYKPDGIVTVSRDRDGQAVRIIGVDGVLQRGLRVSSEGNVHGAIGGSVIVSVGGTLFAAPDSEEPIVLGAGRVLAVGRTSVVRVTCLSVDSCSINSGPIESPGARSVPLPDLVIGVAPGLWSTAGSVSPDDRFVAFHLAQAAGTIRGVLAIDLETGASVHSPEVSAGLSHFRWAPDSRYITYVFDGDIMVWDTQAGPDVLPSARIRTASPVSAILLRER